MFSVCAEDQTNDSPCDLTCQAIGPSTLRVSRLTYLLYQPEVIPFIQIMTVQLRVGHRVRIRTREHRSEACSFHPWTLHLSPQELPWPLRSCICFSPWQIKSWAQRCYNWFSEGSFMLYGKQIILKLLSRTATQWKHSGPSAVGTMFLLWLNQILLCHLAAFPCNNSYQ